MVRQGIPSGFPGGNDSIDACVFVVLNDFEHLIFYVKLHFLKALLLKFVLFRDMRFGLDRFNLTLKLRMLLGKRPEFLISI